ncbi:MAG TPA: hypothetical protein VGE62_00535 [Candidatus Paceibacterota bacterium]
MLGLNKEELRTFKRLSTPVKIQDFLDSLAINWEKEGETNLSPRRVLRERKAHCIEGGLLAAVALWINGEKPLIIELKTPGEAGHIVTLYKRNGYWGAISKTNHNALRFRDPVYKTVRELVMSYFHECTNDQTGKKVLRSYSGPFNVKKWGMKWITSEGDLYYIAEEIFDAPSHELFPRINEKLIRPADKFERRVGRIIEWDREDVGT